MKMYLMTKFYLFYLFFTIFNIGRKSLISNDLESLDQMILYLSKKIMKNKKFGLRVHFVYRYHVERFVEQMSSCHLRKWQSVLFLHRQYFCCQVWQEPSVFQLWALCQGGSLLLLHPNLVSYFIYIYTYIHIEKSTYETNTHHIEASKRAGIY